MKVRNGTVNNCEYWRPKVTDKFDSFLNNDLGKTQHNSGNEAKSKLLFWFEGCKCENPEEKY